MPESVTAEVPKVPKIGRPEFPNKNVPKHHPLERVVRNVYADKLKYCHNSVNNPIYPVKKNAIKDSNKLTQFTIVGNFVCKDFIECVDIVNMFHNYRKRVFDVPVIRGVTGVEWPAVLNELKRQHGDLAYCFEGDAIVFINNKYLGGKDELKKMLNEKYHYNITQDYYRRAVQAFVDRVRSSGRPHAYMHIAIDEQYVGTLIFMLYADLLPITSENFLRLCRLSRGGYSGTPIHRIVKDGWIQCGGFGLKKVNMACENYIVPPDRRGVLCMANDGRNRHNSTQFFVLSQPAEWMAYKYVAFGQLIDGGDTLRKIEEVPTYYESPTSSIVIMDAGVLNLECHGIMPTVGTNEFIEGHIEDLVLLGELFINELMSSVFIEIEFREVSKLQHRGEGAEETMVHETKRFFRNKEEIHKQIAEDKSQAGENENNEFDVEVYEPEEYSSYQHVSLGSSDVVIKERKPYYIEMTDVKDPGDLDSVFDFKRLLKGYYCLEADLATDNKDLKTAPKSDMFTPYNDYTSPTPSEISTLDSDEEKEIKTYLKQNLDHVSFAGEIIRGIAKSNNEYTQRHGRSEPSHDGALVRKFQVSSFYKIPKMVSIDDDEEHEAGCIQRRQTKYERLCKDSSEPLPTIMKDENERKRPKGVRIAQPPANQRGQMLQKIYRRQTGFPSLYIDSETEMERQSVLTRLYDKISFDSDDAAPTLKDYKPVTEIHKMKLMLTQSGSPHKDEEDSEEMFRPNAIAAEKGHYSHMMTMQHGFETKISADYIKTIGEPEQSFNNSIRSIQFARTRPSISISQYKLNNKQYQELQKPEPEKKTLTQISFQDI